MNNDELQELKAWRKDAIEYLQDKDSKINKITALLKDDAYAASFQSMGQYRAALIAEINAA